MEITILKLILNLLVLLTSLPVGYFLAWLCKDEIIYRKWMFIIFYSFIFVFLICFIFVDSLSILFSLIYMILVTIVSITKSKNKKFLEN
jgi:hypothetical protein